jgi:hypothetical protein
MYFQLVPSTHRTVATEFGLLPTPCVADTEGSPKRPDQITMKNGRFVGMIPTPTASDWKGGTIRTGENEKFQDNMLQHYIRASVEQDSKTSQLNPPFVCEMMGFPVSWCDI